MDRHLRQQQFALVVQVEQSVGCVRLCLCVLTTAFELNDL